MKRAVLWILCLILMAACSSSDTGILSSGGDAAKGKSSNDEHFAGELEEFACDGERIYLARCGAGWLEQACGLYILHLKGTPYEMGLQHGTLLREQILENLASVTAELLGGAGMDDSTRAILNELGPVLLGIVGEIMEPFIPGYFREELQGICEAAGVPYLKIIGLHTFLDTTDYLASLSMRLEKLSQDFDDQLTLGEIPGLSDELGDVPAALRFFLLGQTSRTIKALGSISPGGCTIFGAWGDASEQGRTVFARVLDFPWMPTLMQNSVLTLYEPATEGSRPFASLGWAGYIGGLTGMNASGLTFGETTLTGRSATILGVPFFLLCRQVLQFSADVVEALDLVEGSPRTTGYSMLIMDPASGGVVVEESGGLLWGELLCGNPGGPFFTRTHNTPPDWLDPVFAPYVIGQVEQTLVTANCAITDYRLLSWPVNARYARIMQRFADNKSQFGYAMNPGLARVMVTDRCGLDGTLGGEGHTFRRDGDPLTHGTLQDAVFVAEDLDLWIDADHSEVHASPLWVHLNLAEEFGSDAFRRP